MTIRLPEKKTKAIREQLSSILKKKEVTLNIFQKIAGKLQHASFGIPGGEGLFSPIQEAMKGDPPKITINDNLKIILKDWKYVIAYMDKHPTSIHQLITKYPNYIGYTDACKLGCGGVWCSGLDALDPVLWAFEWPPELKQQIQTPANPKALLSINDLELLGQVLGWLILEAMDISLKHGHIGLFCDNQSTVEWLRKLRTSQSRPAGRLLRLLGLRIHQTQASSLTPLHIAGELNIMADIISRSFKHGKFFMENSSLLDYFNTHFPLPQNKSWKQFQLPTDWISRVISLVLGEQLPLASLLRLPKAKKNIGSTGQRTLQNATSTPGSRQHLQSTETSSLQLSLQGSGQAFTEKEIKSLFKESLRPCRPLARPSNWLDSVAPSTVKMAKHTRSR